MLISDDQLKTLIINLRLLDQKKLEEVSSYAKNSQISVHEALIEKDVVTDENLGIMIADFLKVPFIVLAKVSISEDVFRVIPERVARRHKIIPFERTSEGIKIAMLDPSDRQMQEMIAWK